MHLPVRLHLDDLLIGRIFGGASNLPLIAKLVEVSGSAGAVVALLTAAAFVSMALPLVLFFSPAASTSFEGLLAGAVKG